MYDKRINPSRHSNPNVYVPNNRDAKYIKLKKIDLKAQTDKFIIRVGYLITPLKQLKKHRKSVKI